MVLAILAGAPLPLAWTLAFGSCLHQDNPAPALSSAAAARPDVFVFLGDNLYNDLDSGGMPCEPAECRKRNGFWPKLKGKLLLAAFELIAAMRPVYAKALAAKTVREHNFRTGEYDMDALAAAYQTLRAKREFIALRDAVPSVLATWDDHDFCCNDADVSCPWAEQSRAQFLRFWRSDGALVARGARRGVHEAYTYHVDGRPPTGGGAAARHTVRVIVLDTRSFRTAHILPSANASVPSAASCRAEAGVTPYCQQTAAGATLLGEEQWAWLEAELRVAADVRIIASSISFGAEFHQNGDETWAVYPREQERLLALLHTTAASGVVFISGDLHYGEISEVSAARGAPYKALFDLTSSLLLEALGK